MPTLEETVYPRLKSHPGEKELQEVYLPTSGELEWARRLARQPLPRLGLLVLLKTFQRLGYFVQLHEVPVAIIERVGQALGLLILPEGLPQYDASGTRSRHLGMIRERLGVRAFAEDGQAVVERTLRELALTKQDLRDLINGAVEVLVKERIELPGFSLLELQAERIRAETHKTLFERVYLALSPEAREQIDELLA